MSWAHQHQPKPSDAFKALPEKNARSATKRNKKIVEKKENEKKPPNLDSPLPTNFRTNRERRRRPDAADLYFVWPFGPIVEPGRAEGKKLRMDLYIAGWRSNVTHANVGFQI